MGRGEERGFLATTKLPRSAIHVLTITADRNPAGKVPCRHFKKKRLSLKATIIFGIDCWMNPAISFCVEIVLIPKRWFPQTKRLMN